jgi:hypothetical protein
MVATVRSAKVCLSCSMICASRATASTLAPRASMIGEWLLMMMGMDKVWDVLSSRSQNI